MSEHHNKYPADEFEADQVVEKYTKMKLIDPNGWREFVALPSAEATLMKTSLDDLPEPLNESEFNYSKVLDEPFDVDAYLNIDAPELHISQVRNWKRNIITEIKQRALKQKLEAYDNIPHDDGALYIEVAPGHAVRIEASSDINTCTISMTLEDIAGLDYNQDHPQSLQNTHDIVNDCKMLRNCLSAWATTLDAARTQLCTQKDRDEHDGRDLAKLELTPPSRTVEEVEPAGMSRKPGFHAIIGYDNIKEQLADIALCFKFPAVAAALGLSETSSVILHGPSGTGKTKLLKAFAEEVDARLEELSSADVFDKWVGSSGKKLNKYFQELADNNEPVVLLMDEFDSLGARDADPGERSDVVNMLKTWILKINKDYHHIMIVAATNHIDQVDPALTSAARLQAIEIPLPNESTREMIWSSMLSDIALSAMESLDDMRSVNEDGTGTIVSSDIDRLDIAGPVDTALLAGRCDDMTGSHVVEILNRIRRQRLRTYSQTGHINPITQAELLQGIEDVRRTMTD